MYICGRDCSLKKESEGGTGVNSPKVEILGKKKRCQRAALKKSIARTRLEDAALTSHSYESSSTIF